MMVEIIYCANVFREEKVQCPVKCHTNLFVQAGQLAQVNCPPQPQVKKPEKLKPKIRATPMRRPTEASSPMVLNENDFKGRRERQPRYSAPQSFPRVSHVARFVDATSPDF